MATCTTERPSAPTRPSRLLGRQLFASLAKSASGSVPQLAAERRAFHVARRRADGRVSQTVAHGAQLANGRVQLLGLGGQYASVDLRAPVGCEHARDFVERKAR